VFLASRLGKEVFPQNSCPLSFENSGFPLDFQVFNCKTDQKKVCNATMKLYEEYAKSARIPGESLNAKDNSAQRE